MYLPSVGRLRGAPRHAELEKYYTRSRLDDLAGGINAIAAPAGPKPQSVAVAVGDGCAEPSQQKRQHLNHGTARIGATLCNVDEPTAAMGDARK